MADDEKPKELVKKPTILYIIGGNSWDVPHDPDGVREAFKKQGHDVIIMGASEEKGALHGQKDILLKDIATEVDKLAKAGKPFTVYFDTHGGMDNDTHKILLGDQFDRAKLYEDIKKAHPDAKKFTVTVKRGGETYRQFDRRAEIDTTKPMTFEEAQSAVDKVRGIGPSTSYTRKEEEEKDFQATSYGGGGIFGGSYRPITIEIKPEGSDKAYTIPLSRATPTKDVFRTITEHAGKTPFSIFSTPCYGGGACIDLDKNTPKGTVFVSLSDGYQPVYVNDTETLIRAVGQLRAPDYSQMREARDFLEEKGGILTVTLPGQKEPALKVTKEKIRPDKDDLEKVRKLWENKEGTLTLTTPDQPDKPQIIEARPDVKTDTGTFRINVATWGDTIEELEKKGGKLTIKTKDEKAITLEFKKKDSKDWNKAEALLIEQGGILEVTAPDKKIIKVESKPLEIPFNAQNLLMVYLQHSMWGGDGERNKKVLPAPIIGVSGVGIVDLDKKLWDVGLIPNQQELQKARKMLEEQGGTLTVTLPDTKEPALKIEAGKKPDYEEIEKARKTLEEKGGTLTMTTLGAKDAEIKIELEAGKKIDEGKWYEARKLLEEKGGVLAVTTAKKETLKVEYKKLDAKDWEKASTLLGEKGGSLSVTTPEKEIVNVDFKKPNEKTLEKARALLAAGGALKVTHPGMKEDALTIDVLPLDKRSLDEIGKNITAEQTGKTYKPLKDSKLYSQALMLSLASDPTTNESVRNVKAYRDFYRALEPRFTGDRIELAKDAISRGVKPEKVVNRVDSGFFGSYTDHETAMTMAIRTENADLVGLLVKHGQKLNDDYVAHAVERGDVKFADRVLALYDKEKFEAGDKLGSRLLAVAVRNKDEEMFRYLEKKGAQLSDSAKHPELLEALFESRFTENRYDHKKHEPFLKYLVEEKKVPVFDKDQKAGGVLYKSAYFGKDAFEYMLDKTVKQSGKKPSELLGMPVEAHRDGETLVHAIATFGKPDVLEIILKHRPDDLNKPSGDYSKEPPLVKAFIYANHGTAKKLLEMKADINVSGEHRDLGDMALRPILGKSSDVMPMVKLLVENGYNIFSQGKERNSIGHFIGGTLKQRAGYKGNEVTDYLEKKEKEIQANADKFVAATKDMKKTDILKKIQEKDSGFTPAVLKSVIELEDYEQSKKEDKPKKRFTDEQRETIEEVLKATKKVGLLNSPDKSYASAAIPSLDQFLGSGLQGAPIRIVPDGRTTLPI